MELLALAPRPPHVRTLEATDNGSCDGGERGWGRQAVAEQPVGEVTVGGDGMQRRERTARNGRPGEGDCILQQWMQHLLEGE
jgi:hypothetical protein